MTIHALRNSDRFAEGHSLTAHVVVDGSDSDSDSDSDSEWLASIRRGVIAVRWSLRDLGFLTTPCGGEESKIPADEWEAAAGAKAARGGAGRS